MTKTANIDEDALFNYYPFEGDRDVDVVRFGDKLVKGRKEYECHICAEIIKKGEMQRALSECDRDEQKVMTFRFCWDCCVAMAQSNEDSGDAIEKRYRMDKDRGNRP
jgi:hypothetical protein